MSTIISLLAMKCPRCHKGKLFVRQNPFNLKMLSKMPEKCSCCELLFEPEPGFYYGAMFVSYFLCIPIMFLNYFIFEEGMGISGPYFLTANAIVLLILWPVIFRYARVFYIYLFVGFDESFKKGKLN
jgi:uncharacterized protein (DUF983 family)